MVQRKPFYSAGKVSLQVNYAACTNDKNSEYQLLQLVQKLTGKVHLARPLPDALLLQKAFITYHRTPLEHQAAQSGFTEEQLQVGC